MKSTFLLAKYSMYLNFSEKRKMNASFLSSTEWKPSHTVFSSLGEPLSYIQNWLNWTNVNFSSNNQKMQRAILPNWLLISCRLNWTEARFGLIVESCACVLDICYSYKWRQQQLWEVWRIGKSVPGVWEHLTAHLWEPGDLHTRVCAQVDSHP